MQTYEHGDTGILTWNHQGNSYTEDVIYAGLNLNSTGRTPGVDKGHNEPAVWITNRHDKTMPLPITFAKEFFVKPGQKYRFATEEELPPISKEKIFPHDELKNPNAQHKETTTMTSREVQAELEAGKSVEKSELSYKELREIAKKNNIKTFQRSRPSLEEELQSKDLI